MSEGYHCDSCGQDFQGESAMLLEATLSDDFAAKIKADNKQADYCPTCAKSVLSAIGKRWAK